MYTPNKIVSKHTKQNVLKRQEAKATFTITVRDIHLSQKLKEMK